jgi:hypothetical protein
MAMKRWRTVLLGCASVAVIAGGWVLAGQQPDIRAVEARSDRFWNALAVNGSARSHFATLDEMADGADIIVVGRIDRLAAGREVRDLEAEALGMPREEASVYFADATIVVDDAIKGSSRQTVMLQLMVPGPDAVERLGTALPTERAIFFLTDMGVYFARENPTSGIAATLKGTFDFVSPQGLLRDFGARVGVTADEGDAFLEAASGKAFRDVLAETKAAAD